MKRLKKPRRNIDLRVKLYADELGRAACMLIVDGCYLFSDSCSW